MYSTPETGADVLLRHFTNLATLGEPEGLKAVLNAVLTADINREEPVTSPVYHELTQEYPLLYVLPMGSARPCGKTTFGRELGRALVPGLPVTQANTSIAIPVQQALAESIEANGTAVLDEFQLPTDASHVLSLYSLVALATGALLSPGKASENAYGVSLRHPLVLIGQAGPVHASLVSRSIPLFLTAIEGEAPASLVGEAAREAHQRWMQETDIIASLRAALVTSATLRFDVHYTLATLFGGAESVDRYLAKAHARMTAG